MAGLSSPWFTCHLPLLIWLHLPNPTYVVYLSSTSPWFTPLPHFFILLSSFHLSIMMEVTTPKCCSSLCLHRSAHSLQQFVFAPKGCDLRRFPLKVSIYNPSSTTTWQCCFFKNSCCNDWRVEGICCQTHNDGPEQADGEHYFQELIVLVPKATIAFMAGVYQGDMF